MSSGEAALIAAPELWGQDTAATTDALWLRHGDDAEVATIGVAGERGVAFASVVSSRSFPAPRMGLGAVMGAKRLKAIVLIGGEPPELADPAQLDRITADYATAMLVNPLSRSQFEPPGFGAWAWAGAAITSAAAPKASQTAATARKLVTVFLPFTPVGRDLATHAPGGNFSDCCGKPRGTSEYTRRDACSQPFCSAPALRDASGARGNGERPGCAASTRRDLRTIPAAGRGFLS